MLNFAPSFVLEAFLQVTFDFIFYTAINEWVSVRTRENYIPSAVQRVVEHLPGF